MATLERDESSLVRLHLLRDEVGDVLRVDDVADLKVRAVAGETLSRILDVVRREETYGY